VLEPPPHFTLGKPLPGNWPTTMPAKPTPSKRRESIEQLPWDSFPLMPSDCTICTAMSGNGVLIPGTITIMIIVLLCGAVVVAPLRMNAVPLTATTTTAAPTATTSVFGWCAVLGGLSSRKEFNLVSTDLQKLGGQCPP